LVREVRLDDAVDFGRDFVPETFTPLFYTPLYAELAPDQRRRYNQLHGCYCNEQIMFFEKFVAENVLSGLLSLADTAPLALQLGAFLEEERRHTVMFRDLNRLCLPQLYRRKEFYFVAVPRALEVLLGRATRHRRFFPLFVWLMLLQEERAVFLGREILRLKEELEPRFVALHRVHLADEIEHVQWDQEILALTWNRATSRFRRISAKVLGRIIREFMITPKRANLRVVAELGKEFPELAPRLTEMKGALLALAHNRDWNVALYSRSIVPKTFALFDRWPEFSSLARVLCGYQPKGEVHG